jgi:hypothetical protein
VDFREIHERLDDGRIDIVKRSLIINLYAPVAQLDRAPAFQRSLYGELKPIECMWLYARKSLEFLRIICRQPLNYR